MTLTDHIPIVLLFAVIVKYGIKCRTIMNCHACGQKYILIVLAVLTIVFGSTLAADYHAYAQGAGEKAGASDSGSRLIGAGMAFGLAAAGSGIGLGFVGAAGLAAISDNPKMQSRVFIFVGMVESIAIYGIVMMFIILGQ
jgi:V/A-type H+/Na+-transporting ATPase subunit K